MRFNLNFHSIYISKCLNQDYAKTHVARSLDSCLQRIAEPLVVQVRQEVGAETRLLHAASPRNCVHHRHVREAALDTGSGDRGSQPQQHQLGQVGPERSRPNPVPRGQPLVSRRNGPNIVGRRGSYTTLKLSPLQQQVDNRAARAKATTPTAEAHLSLALQSAAAR